MDELERIKFLAEGSRISRLEHAKRIGRTGMKDTLRLLDVLFEANVIESETALHQLKELHTDLRELLKILNDI